MNRTVISVLIICLFFASETLLAKVNISSQSIMDSAIQSACDNKFDDEQDILKCIAQAYKPSESITLNYSSAKVYEVEFSGFGENLVLTPKENGKTLIVEVDGYYIYASKIYNMDTCCNPKAPIIILERFYTRNNMMSDCNPCSTSSEFWVYRLASPDSQPLVIDTSPKFY
ncbi:hypothetical protein [Thiomicrorhabdus sp.]|uniref:hypothetical protein n=1 Tax=Thiomicrorhabdus sp. TaxID=2039724 RepID=UPI0029C9696D|nr:hypothetical protein [Thiomicrorhabdus sp.]